MESLGFWKLYISLQFHQILLSRYQTVSTIDCVLKCVVYTSPIPHSRLSLSVPLWNVPWPKEWNWCARADLHFKQRAQAGRVIVCVFLTKLWPSHNPRKRGNGHHHHTPPLPPAPIPLVIPRFIFRCYIVKECPLMTGFSVPAGIFVPPWY
jgi:hypothetical protein